MLGLGSLLSAAASLRTEVQRLFSKLRARSTYYENNDDSQASVKDTFNYGLLDKATTVLTPTATSDALVHSVKTYTGDELVDNGDFSGGTTGWTNNGTSILSVSNGVMTINRNSGGVANQCHQDLTTVNGNKYILSINQIAASHGIQLNIGGTGYANLPATIGIRKISFTASSTTTRISINPSDSTAATAQVGDVSVIDISSDFTFDRASSATRINSDGLIQDMQSITDPEYVKNGDFSQIGSEIINNGTYDTDINWTKETGWSIANGVASSVDSGNGEDLQQGVGGKITSGKTYKVEYTISNRVTGGVKTFLSGGGAVQGNTNTANGTYTDYLTAPANNTTFKFTTASGGFTGSIDNVSVKEVLQDWSFTGAASGYQQYTGSGIKMYSGSVSDANNALSRSGTLNLSGTNGKLYKMEITASDFVNGTAGFVRLDGVYDANNIISFVTGTQTVHFTAYRDFTFIQFFAGSADAFITVNSISIKEVSFSDDVDLARINYDGSGQNGHILLEPTSTNLITYSEDLTQGSTNRLSVTPNATTSPDGTNTADKLIPNNTSSTYHYFAINSLSINSNHRYSVYLKKSEYEYALINFETSGTSGSSKNAIINLNNGNIESTNFTSVSVTNEGNGWYRCSVQATASRTSIAIYPLPSSDTGSFTGDNTSGIFAWGIQLEALPYPTSYIPTLVGSTVTRAAETLNSSGNTTLINSTEGVLFAEIAALADDLTFRSISLNDGTNTNSVGIRYRTNSNRVNAIIKDGTGVTFQMNFDVSDITQFNKIALKYKSGDNSLYINGTKVLTSSSTFSFTSVLNNASFDRGGGNDDFFGKCKQLAVFNEALEDDELELLTGITNFSSFNATASGGGYTII